VGSDGFRLHYNIWRNLLSQSSGQESELNGKEMKDWDLGSV
jgi:hypothetical protein